MVGTNLYDFTYAGPVFHVRGILAHYYPQSTELQIPTGLYQIGPPIDPRTDERIAYGLEGFDLQLFVAAYQIKSTTGQAGLLTEQEFWARDASIRKFYQPVYTSVFLLNYPTPGSPPATEKIESKVRHSTAIDQVAVATINKGFFDCGKPYTGDPKAFSITYVLLQNRIGIRTNSSIAPKKSENQHALSFGIPTNVQPTNPLFKP